MVLLANGERKRMQELMKKMLDEIPDGELEKLDEEMHVRQKVSAK